MDDTKNTDVTTVENSTKGSAKSVGTKRVASSSKDNKGKSKDISPSEKDQTGILAEGFCGFESADTPPLIRSTREASKNATAILTKKSASKLERVEDKSDSPPDLVLFLKEGRGRAQYYSDPPTLDPENIATRRRTKVPEDPVALISRAKSTEKTKKHQKETTKKERKTKVMETPESLKRLVKEGSKQGQASGKESSDSGTEEKTLKKIHSKGSEESDIKVKCMETSSGSEEKQSASISRKSNKGKRNSTDEPELEVVETIEDDSSDDDIRDGNTNYSNLGTILDKMTKNNADKRIPVVIMSKSEKEPKVDPAKPRSKKKVSKSSSTAVLKIAIPKVEGSSMSPPKTDDKEGVTQPCRDSVGDSEADKEVIVLKVTSDVRTEGKNIFATTKDKTVYSIANEGSSSLAEKVQMRPNILLPKSKKQVKTDVVSGMKEAAVDGSSQTSVLRPGQGSSPFRFNSVVTPIKPSLVLPSIKPNILFSSVQQNPSHSTIKSKPLTAPFKSSTVMSRAKSKPIISTIKSSLAISPIKSSPNTPPIKSSLATSPIKSSPNTSPIKLSPNTSPIKSSPNTSPIKSNPVTSPIKSDTVTSSIKTSTVTASIKSSTITSPLKSGSVMSPITYGSATSSIKSSSVSSSSSQSKKSSPFVVSMSQIISFGGVKGSVKMTNFTPSKMSLKMSSSKGTSISENIKSDITRKQECGTNTAEIGSRVGGDESQDPQVSTNQGSNSSSQKGHILDYTDIETQEVILGESDDSNGQVDRVGDMPIETDLLAHEELGSSSEEDIIKISEQSIAAKESLSPEGRVALDHCYSSGGSSTSRKKSPSTYEKSLTPRPVYSNASTAKRSLDIMLHNDKINILRQMSQIFNDEKPPLQIFSDENTVQPEADITVISSDGEDETSVCARKTEENIPPTKCSSKSSKGITADAMKKGTSLGRTTKASIVDENYTDILECSPSKSTAIEVEPKVVDLSTSSDANTSSESSSGGAFSSPDGGNSLGIEFTTPMKGKKEENASGKAIQGGFDSPFLGFPDPDPKVHHVPAYSLSLNEKILVQSKVGPAGEIIDIVNGFSFTSFISEEEMMSYDGTYSGKSTRAHRRWLIKKRRKRYSKFYKHKKTASVYPKVLQEESASNVANIAASPKDKRSTADSGAFASDDLDIFLDKNSHLNISYQIPKCKVTEEGVSKIDEEEMLEPTPPIPSQTSSHSPDPPHSSPNPHSPSSPHSPHTEMVGTEDNAVVGVNPNTSAMDQHDVSGAITESVHQYEEVNAIDILYPKEKYKYYYNKELCKETKADASDVFVRRAGKLVPLSTVLKSQKCPAPEPSTKKSVELVYIYDGGKLLTLGGSLTKINPSNSDSVRARVVLPIGVPPIPTGETVKSRAKKVQAVEINEDMAKFALSALQSSHLKSEQPVDKKDGEEEGPPVPEPNSTTEKDEKMKVDVPKTTLVEKTETAATQAVPLPVPIKPTKRNILDIIAAKLAMSDDDSDGKEAEEKEATGDTKEAAGDTKEAAGDTKEAVDTKEAAVDTKEVSGDTKKATVDTKEAAVDMKKAVDDTKKASVDTKEASVDTKEAAVDTKKIVDDTKEATVGTKEISVDTKEAAVDTKETSVDTKVVAVDTKVAVVDTKMAAVDTKETSVDTKKASVDMKVVAVDTKMAAFDTKEASVDMKVTAVDTKVAKLTKEASVDMKKASVDTKNAAVDTKKASVDSKDAAVDTKKTSVDTKDAAVDTKVAVVDTKEATGDTKVAAVDTKKAAVTKEATGDTKETAVDTKKAAVTKVAAVDTKEAVDDTKEAAVDTKDINEVATKLVTVEEKEEGVAVKEESKDIEISLVSSGTSKRKNPFVKLEALEEESEDMAKVKLQGLEKKKTVEPKSEVKQEGEIQAEDDTVQEIKKLTPTAEAADLTNILGKENKSEPLSLEESSKVSEPEQLMESKSVEDVMTGAEKVASRELVIPKEKEKEKEASSFKGKDGASREGSEKKGKETELLLSLEEEKKTEVMSSKNEKYICKVSEKNDDKAELIVLEEKGGESKLMTPEESKVNVEGDIDIDVVVEKKSLNKGSACPEKGKNITSGEEDSCTKNSLVNLTEKMGPDEEAETNKEDSTIEEIKKETETEVTAAVLIPETNENPSSEIFQNEAQGNMSDEDTLSTPKSVISVPNSDTVTETPKSTLYSSLESDDKIDSIDLEEKEEFPELGNQETLRMEIKSKIFKKNMYRFPSLSREMKRLSMNFVNYEPPHEIIQEKEKEVIPELKEDCDNEHCKLGCVCDSLSWQRKSVEHCGRIECMFECTCRDESWKLPSGSGRTMNAVSIFNLDREQKEGLAIREKDFRRTVIQTGSEVILVGAERKKREIRLPGRYRDPTVWAASDMDADINFVESPDLPLQPGTQLFEPSDLPLQPDYPGIPLSEASKYIKNFKLNIPWYDVKGISIWCMDHSCYDCRCLTDPTFNDPTKVESPRKNTSSRVKTETSVPKSSNEPSTSALSALLHFEEALKIKENPDCASSTVDKEVKKTGVVVDANCSIMNIIVNNAETRRKYTWKLKEWYHHTEEFSARTAGYSKKKITEETKNMTLTGLAARDTTPEQIVESVVRSLRHQKSSEELKLPAIPCSNNFEPFMGDSLINLQNAIGFNPDSKKSPKAETSCPLVDLTNGNEEISFSPKKSKKSKKVYSKDVGAKGHKNLKGTVKRKLSGSVEPSSKKANLTKYEGARMGQVGSSNQLSFLDSYQSNSDEPHASHSKQTLPKKTLSLLEMMLAEENRGELELDLSDNIPGNALLVAEARFRKLINMNIIGVIGINKAGRCIIGTVDSEEALQVMHQIQNMIRNNTLDVGPNMREIFFPPPYVGIRPRYVMIRCDTHFKWEIVGVVQKKGPVRSPNKASEVKGKVDSFPKPQVPQVIDLEEEEKEKQLLWNSNDMKQENEVDMVEPPSPEEKDSGDWEGSLPLIASVHSASDSNMAELIGSPEATQEELEKPEEPQAPEAITTSSCHETSPTSQKTLPDLVPITASSQLDMLYQLEKEAKSLSLEMQEKEGENLSQQKLYFVPTVFHPSTTKSAIPSIPTDTPMKSITLNVASNKVFGNISEKPESSSKSHSCGKVSYILPKFADPRKTDSSTFSSKQNDFKKPAVSKAEEGCDSDNGQASSSSTMMYIPVTSGCVSKVLIVPTPSGGSSRMMLLPSTSTSSSMESCSSSSAITTTTTIINTPITSTTSTAAITTSKMKMVLVPSSQDGNKMLLIPAGTDSYDGAAATSTIGNLPVEGERKKMLVLPSSVINNFMARSSSETALSQPYQQSCKGTLLVPLPNTGNHFNTPQQNEKEKSSEFQLGDGQFQDNSDDVIVIGPTITRISSESSAVRQETSSLLISPAPMASSSGVAETNVVSSLTTISSTMQDHVSSPDIKSEPNSEVSSHVKRLVTGEMNTLFDKTHEEMVSDTKSVEGLSMECPKEEVCENENSEKGPVNIAQSQNLNIGKTKDIQDQKRQVLIKKGGFHWSAVDLSLNFKSVKLEWLLGTIRKNVLVNIYQMSKKTYSPVTLSVKNGTSTSMLYGFARACKSSALPVLILGSVVSAVLSSSSVPDSLLFQINSIKYFIRESTGELSSYTYSSETHLVKLASKKRGNAGEMVGIGENIEIYKMRDSVYQTHSEKDTAGKALSSLSSSGLTTQTNEGCTCTEVGNLTCLQHSEPTCSSKQTGARNTPTHFPSEDSSSRALDNDSMYASLGCQDITMDNIHHQEDPILENSKLPCDTKKSHSDLRYLLTKSKDLSHEKKSMLDMNKKRLTTTLSNEEDCQAIVAKSSQGRKKSKLKAVEDPTTVNNEMRHLKAEKYGELIVPKVECESEEDIDVLGDTDSSQTILTDLWLQLEKETTEVQKIINSVSSSKEFVKRKTLKMPQDGPPLKKARIGVSVPGVERPCPRSKKTSVEGKVKKIDPTGVMEMVGKEEPENKDTVELLSRHPTPLAHSQSSAGDSPVMMEENDFDSCILTKGKMSSHDIKQQQLMSALCRTKQKVKMLFDGEGVGDERNTELHNKLERMRRKMMRHLFKFLQMVIIKVPRNPLVTRNVTHPKKSVLCAGQKVCEILRDEELRLIREEAKVRNERSVLIKHLATIIGESTEEIKVKWRNWVKEHMQNPKAKKTFEDTWEPASLMKDILKNIIEESTSDMDNDEGSPLPTSSPVPGPLLPQSRGDKLIPVKTKRQYKKRILKKKGKKPGRPHKIVVTTGSSQGSAFAAESNPLPTSILLMAGTSSRGRKIVRKEDTNFVTR